MIYFYLIFLLLFYSIVYQMKFMIVIKKIRSIKPINKVKISKQSSSLIQIRQNNICYYDHSNLNNIRIIKSLKQTLMICDFSSNQSMYYENVLSQGISFNFLEYFDKEATFINYPLTQLISFPSSSLKNFMIIDSQIQNIDYFLNKNLLPNLICLQIQNCKLKTIPKLKIRQIEILKLSKNQLESIELFSHGQYDQLRQIDLSQNGLIELPILICQKLQTLKINNNWIQDLSQFTKGDYPQLKELNISNNLLQIIPMLQKFVNLQQLDFTQNMICSIQQFSYGSYQNLQFLRLNCNKLIFMPSLKTPNLKYLSLEKNNIQNLKQFSQSCYNKLAVLNVSNNNFNFLPIFKTPNITNFNFMCNQIEEIQFFSTGSYHILSQVNLSFNKIKKVPELILGQLCNLNLENNLIQDISDFMKDYSRTNVLCLHINFYDKNSLYWDNICFPSTIRILSIKKNKITDKDFQHLINLLSSGYVMRLQLQENQITKLHDIQTLDKLTDLKLKGNPINDIQMIVSEKYSQLKILELNKQNLTYDDQELFQNLQTQRKNKRNDEQ